MTQTRIAGESIDDLARALRQIELLPRKDGSAHVRATMETEISVPFHRALLRIEAELLLQEAHELTVDGPSGEPRGDSERRAEAFVELLLRLCDAVGSPLRPADRLRGPRSTEA